MMSVKDEAREAQALVKSISQILAGTRPAVQGAVLADLLALWLAGHVAPGEPEATRRVRERLLEMHLKTVWALIDINYKARVEPQVKARMQ